MSQKPRHNHILDIATSFGTSLAFPLIGTDGYRHGRIQKPFGTFEFLGTSTMLTAHLMARINRIFDGLLGCPLEFQAASSLTSDEWNEDDLLIFQTSTEGYPLFVEHKNENAYGFPVNIRGDFMGLAIAKINRGTSEFSGQKVVLLAELFPMVLSDSLKTEERLDHLRMLEQRLYLIQSSPNVIPLHPNRLPEAVVDIDLNTLMSTQNTSQNPHHKSPLTSLPLLIETKPNFPLQRIAVEIHQRSGRWALVSVEDLPSEIFQSRESLIQLGAITLFIRDISKLTTNQQLKLAEYLSIQPSADMPHVIAGTICPPQELMEKQLVLSHLIDLFCISSLQWTDKSPDQVTRQLIDSSLQHILHHARETNRVGDHVIPFHPQYFDPDHPTMH